MSAFVYEPTSNLPRIIFARLVKYLNSETSKALLATSYKSQLRETISREFRLRVEWNDMEYLKNQGRLRFVLIRGEIMIGWQMRKPADNTRCSLCIGYKRISGAKTRSIRPYWQVHGGYVERSMQMIVTPRVRAEVQAHFNCPELEGAELEDQGEEGTAVTHWEKRVFEVYK